MTPLTNRIPPPSRAGPQLFASPLPSPPTTIGAATMEQGDFAAGAFIEYNRLRQLSNTSLRNNIGNDVHGLLSVESRVLALAYGVTNDFTVSRIFRLGGSRRLRAYAEIFNVMNNSRIFTRNETFGPQWYNPINLVDARRFQFGAQFDF